MMTVLMITSFTLLEHCINEHGSLLNLITSPDSTAPQCDVPLSGESPEVDAIVRQAISRDHNNLMSVAESLYSMANDKLVGCFQSLSD